MKIYIAGKITGLPRAKVVAKFNAARKHLKAQGHDVFIPTVLPYYKSVPHEDYMHICFGMIDICDAIYLLSDWHESRGATMERLYAIDTFKKIIYQDEPPTERPVYNRYTWNAIKQKWQFQYSLCEPFFHENKLALIEQ